MLEYEVTNSNKNKRDRSHEVEEGEGVEVEVGEEDVGEGHTDGVANHGHDL